MKAIINRNYNQNNSNSQEQERRKTVEMQKHLQKIENEYARSMGFMPRCVVYAPYDKSFNRKVIIDYLTENYYPLNHELGLSFDEFRDAVINEMGALIDQQVENESKFVAGFFKVQYPDRVFLFSNVIKHDMIMAENLLIHESLHAGIFDLINQKINKLKFYKSKKYDDEFFLNLLTECQMKPILRNRNESVLSPIGMTDKIFQFYSYEEEFVMFNSLCSILEKELLSSHIDIDKIIHSISIYCGSAGLDKKPNLDNQSIELYGQKIPLKDYIPTYLKILRGPITGYDQTDQNLAEVIKPLDYDNIHFEELDSKIPEFAESIIELIKSNNYSKEIIRRKINDFRQKNKVMS